MQHEKHMTGNDCKMKGNDSTIKGHYLEMNAKRKETDRCTMTRNERTSMQKGNEWNITGNDCNMKRT